MPRPSAIPKEFLREMDELIRLTQRKTMENQRIIRTKKDRRHKAKFA